MSKTADARILVWSAVLSGVVNSFLIASAFLERSSICGRVADAIAGPPGFISNRLFAPKGHSVHAFIAVALGSLIVSFIFYAVISYFLIYAARLLKSWRNDTE